MGNVYFVQGLAPYIKIGYAKDVQKRIANMQSGHPAPLRVLAIIPGNMKLERLYHKALKQYQVHGEWFEVEPVMRVIKRITEGERPKILAGIRYLLLGYESQQPTETAEDGRAEGLAALTSKRIRQLILRVKAREVEIAELTSELKLANLRLNDLEADQSLGSVFAPEANLATVRSGSAAEK